MKTPSLFFNRKISTPIGTVVVLFLALLAGGILVWQYWLVPKYEFPLIEFPPKPEKQVTITTDKTGYEQGETVKIIVKNNSEGAVYLGSCDAYYPEIEKNGAWGRTFLKECETLSIKDEISPEESKILQECETGSKEGPLLPWKFYPGNWRITLGYYLGCVDEEPSRCLSHKTIYSNEFRIKEKFTPEPSYIFDRLKFCPDSGDCRDYGLESRKCNKIGDCVASCHYGCVNKEWWRARGDCEAIWSNFECECIEGLCQRLIP